MAFKINKQPITGIISILIFLLFASMFFYISYIAPLAGDAWKYYVLNGLGGNKPIWDIVATYYTTGYLDGNPRIGQLGMHIAGYGAISTGLVSLFSFLVLFISGMYVVTGKIFKPYHLQDIALLSIFIAVTVHVGRQVGRVYFYSPFTTNYLLAFALLVFFLAVIRFYYAKPLAPPRLKYSITIIAGFFAGMSNEHTVPCFLGLGLLWLMWGWIRKTSKNNYLYSFIAFLSLLVGYVALYFAPGQHVRYSSIKNDGFEALLTDLPGRVTKLFDLATSGQWQLIILLAVILLIILFTKKEKNKNLLWQIVFFISAIGMITVILASPKLGQRLFFASYAAIGFGYVGIVYGLRNHRWVQFAVSIIPIALTSIFMYEALQSYQKYSDVFVAQTARIEMLKKQGLSNLTLDPLNFDYRANREFIYKEYFADDPNHRNNKYRAEIFGVDSIKYNKK